MVRDYQRVSRARVSAVDENRRRVLRIKEESRLLSIINASAYHALDTAVGKVPDRPLHLSRFEDGESSSGRASSASRSPARGLIATLGQQLSRMSQVTPPDSQLPLRRRSADGRFSRTQSSYRRKTSLPRRSHSASATLLSPTTRRGGWHCGKVLLTPSTTLMQLTQGGLTLWTRESDGSVCIRSGGTASVQMVIEPPETGVQVRVLQLVDVSMWIGYADGRVRVYDSLTFAFLYELMCHRGPVTCVAGVADGHVLLGSQDGSAIVLTNESSDGSAGVSTRIDRDVFTQVLMELEAFHTAVSAADTLHNAGYFGSDAGEVIGVDLSCGRELFRVHAHGGRVHQVAVDEEERLFTCGADTVVRVWRATDGHAVRSLRGHCAGVTDLFLDRLSRSLWTADTAGTIRVWSTGTLACMKVLDAGSGSAIVALRGMATIDVTKVWAVGSNGLNAVWCSVANYVENAVYDSLHCVRDVVEKDGVELRKWNDLLCALQAAEAARLELVASLAERTTLLGVLRTGFIRWKWWLVQRDLDRLNGRAGQLHLSIAAAEAPGGSGREARRAAHRQHLAKLLHMRVEATARSRWFTLWRHAARRSSRARHLRSLSICTQRENLGRLARGFFVLWKQYTRHSQRCLRRGQWATVRHCSALHSLQLRYWRLWRSFIRPREDGRTACDRVLHVVGRYRTQLLQRRYFVALAGDACRPRGVAMRLREAHAAALLAGATARGHARSRFFLWYQWTREQVLERRSHTLIEVKEQLAVLTRELSGFSAVAMRQQLIEECDEAIDVALAAHAQRRRDIAATRDMTQALQKGNPDLEATTGSDSHHHVAFLLSTLKCEVLNFATDRPLIAKVCERMRLVGFERMFLEAHQVMKRVVVDMAGEAHTDAAVEWPLTPQVVQTLRPHLVQAVLNAVKTMIIAYDAMPHHKLDTDDEIAANAHHIELIVRRCLEMQSQRRTTPARAPSGTRPTSARSSAGGPRASSVRCFARQPSTASAPSAAKPRQAGGAHRPAASSAPKAPPRSGSCAHPPGKPTRSRGPAAAAA